MANKIDLHIHSTSSDGSDTIPELLDKIRKSGIHTFAVTDHDTIDGAMEMDQLDTEGLRYIRGIEFSCITSYAKCHILGYDFDPNDDVFQDALVMGVRLRQEKLHRRVAFLESEYGIVLTEQEAKWLYSQKSPGKPHFGKILADRGLATDLRAAISQYINPCKDGNDRIDAPVAIQAILHSGGIPVWAHPLGGEGERRLSREEFLVQMQELIRSGIRGLECYYSRYSQEDIAFLVEQALQNNLLISGGSDYHGKNKSNLHLGKLNEDDIDVDQDCITLYKCYFE